MPTLAGFDGIKIQFYFDEHPPPHFHAVFAEHRARIDIRNPTVLNGSLPPAKLRLVLDWAKTRQPQLLRVWLAIEAGDEAGSIE